MKLPENPGYGTICRTPFGTLWVRTGHDTEYPWVQVHTTVERVSDEYVREQGWEVAWSPDEPAAPEPAHRLVIESGFVMFECHAAADSPCHTVYDCGCEEWFAAGVDDGVPWHETETLTECAGESWERKARHFGRFDPRECNARDWIEGDPIECQARGTDGQVVIPVEVAWTGHGVEWRPARGGAR